MKDHPAFNINDRQRRRLIELIKSTETDLLCAKDAINADSPDSAHNQLERAIEKLDKAGKELHSIYYLKQRGEE